MNRRIALAVAIQVAIMALVLVPPLMIRATGTVIYLETEKMDPRALFRGDYVILGYKVAQGILSEEQEQRARSKALPVYVRVSTERPGRFLGVSFEPPELGQGEACIVGRARGWSGAVDFPQVAQFFVPEGTGRALEIARGKDLLARITVSDGCKALLLGLEPR
jgi:uncharacterized membrane-anchored protein